MYNTLTMIIWILLGALVGKTIYDILAQPLDKIANFEKVSLHQFAKDWIGDKSKANYIHTNIILPQRSTKESAGYDFFSPIDFTLNPGETIKIPTGIRAKINNGWVLKIYPRSSIGFKYQVMLANTVGIIDSDYYNSDNEGHIFVKLINDGDKPLNVEQGDRLVQGVFVPYGITSNDKVKRKRNGGIGSSGK